MKKIVLFAVMALMAFTACSQKKSNQQETTKEMKTLIAYFSCTGNTKAVANLIQKAIGADLYEIKPAVAYTEKDLDWRDENSRSSLEMKDSASRPTIGNKVEDMSAYDTLYIGFPIWWDKAPTIVNTFIESYDLVGKTIYLFATSGSSTITNSVAELKKTYPSLKFVEGKLLNGATQQTVDAWVKK